MPIYMKIILAILGVLVVLALALKIGRAHV